MATVLALRNIDQLNDRRYPVSESKINVTLQAGLAIAMLNRYIINYNDLIATFQSVQPNPQIEDLCDQILIGITILDDYLFAHRHVTKTTATLVLNSDDENLKREYEMIKANIFKRLNLNNDDFTNLQSVPLVNYCVTSVYYPRSTHGMALQFILPKDQYLVSKEFFDHLLSCFNNNNILDLYHGENAKKIAVKLLAISDELDCFDKLSTQQKSMVVNPIIEGLSVIIENLRFKYHKFFRYIDLEFSSSSQTSSTDSLVSSPGGVENKPVDLEAASAVSKKTEYSMKSTQSVNSLKKVVGWFKHHVNFGNSHVRHKTHISQPFEEPQAQELHESASAQIDATHFAQGLTLTV